MVTMVFCLSNVYVSLLDPPVNDLPVPFPALLLVPSPFALPLLLMLLSPIVVLMFRHLNSLCIMAGGGFLWLDNKEVGSTGFDRWRVRWSNMYFGTYS